MKKITLLCFLFLITQLSFSQKVVVIGMNHLSAGTSNDGFTFVATEDIPSGQTIYFTDNEYSDTSNAFTFNGAPTGEGVIKYTSGVLTKGDVVFIKEISINTFSVTCSSGGSCGTAEATATSGDFNLATNGDGLYAYSDNDNDVLNGVAEIYSVMFTGSGEIPLQNGGNIPVDQNPVSDFPNALIVDGFADDTDDIVGPDRVEYFFDPASLRNNVGISQLEDASNYLSYVANQDLSLVRFTNLCISPDPSDLTDDDGDGYTECEGDCNDTDATIFPGAPEICDGLDNDCDGLIDTEDDSFVSSPPLAPTPPADLNVQCEDDIPPLEDLTAIDNNDGEITVSPTTKIIYGDCPNNYTEVRTWTFTNSCGNSSSISQTINVNDETAPVPPAAPSEITVQCETDIPLPEALIAIDNCSGGILKDCDGYRLPLVVDGLTIAYVCASYTTINGRGFRLFFEYVNDNFIPTESDDYNAVRDVIINNYLNFGFPNQGSSWGPTVVSIYSSSSDLFSYAPILQLASECGIAQADIEADLLLGDKSCIMERLFTGTAFDPLAGVAELGLYDVSNGIPDGNIVEGKLNEEIIPGTCENNFTLIRTWTFTDKCGNASSVSQTINVNDETGPNAPAAPADITLECGEEIPPAKEFVAIDNCLSSFVQNCNGYSIPLIVEGIKIANVCASYTSINGEGFNLSFEYLDDRFIIYDNYQPLINLLRNNFVNFGFPSGSYGWGPTVFSYNPSGGLFSNAIIVQLASECGIAQADIEADLLSGNQSCILEGLFTSFDPFAGIDALGLYDLTIDFVDNANIAGVLSEEIVPGIDDNNYDIIRTWTFTDECGNDTKTSQTIKVREEPPVAPAPPTDVTVQCADDVPAPVDLTATDKCDGDITVSPSAVITPGSCDNQFKMVRTWTFIDSKGYQSSVSQTINVNDTTPPVAPAAPADVTVQCADDVPAPVDLTATDNCNGDITVSPTAVITPGSCDNQFKMVRTWTFVDACGNQSSVSQTINVDDTTPPVAPAAPADVTVQCADDVPPPLDLTATDNCNGDITVSPTAVITPGNCDNQFKMVRTWTFVDSCGNQSSVSQTINVDDTTPPVAPAAPADVTVQCADDVPPPLDLTATDNCNGDITVSPTAVITPGSCDNQFTMVRTWTFVDTCGNQSSVSQTINVNDTTPPVLIIPKDEIAECDKVPTVGQATATDNCDDTVDAVYLGERREDGDCINNYTLYRTWTAKDICGNTTTLTQTITVQDTTAPIVTGIINNTFDMGCNIDQSTLPDPQSHIDNGDITGKDNCEGDVTIKLD
ncbi:hypothetical protein MWU50_06370, partial [Flavobacteriaceae bacterium S0862]|nr:hypothetical protein [Flavobacteriaceae bacterium S0862]